MLMNVGEAIALEIEKLLSEISEKTHALITLSEAFQTLEASSITKTSARQSPSTSDRPRKTRPTRKIGKRNLSPEARERIRQAQIRRWQQARQETAS